MPSGVGERIGMTVTPKKPDRIDLVIDSSGLAIVG
tara:strand:+ start:15265 stop:15369 length:105 start_codon:yes stop_codon:yes gene_type:complete